MAQKFTFLVLDSDKQKLRIRLTTKISRNMFDCQRKSLYLGLPDNPESWQKGIAIAVAIDNDIRANKLNKDLNYYLPTSELIRSTGLGYDPNEAKTTLSELFNQYKLFLKPTLAVTTYRDRYENLFTKLINRSHQNLNEQSKIIKSFYRQRTGETFNRLCNVLDRTIEWGKRQEKLPEDFPNKVRIITKDYDLSSRKIQVADKVTKIEGYYHDRDYKAFTREEAEIIIQAFENKANEKFRIDYRGREYRHKHHFVTDNRLLAKFVKLKFWTGCRTCEAAALKWTDIDTNFEHIIFQNSYDFIGKQVKPLKREKVGREGTLARKFPCGEKLRLLLKEMYIEADISSNSKDVFLFEKYNGNVIGSSAYLKVRWLGETKRFSSVRSTDGSGKVTTYSPGVVYQLVKEKKISQYLTPYATRHTWINIQLQSGVPISNIAKLAGNSPETIISNYASYIPNIPLAPEI